MTSSHSLLSVLDQSFIEFLLLFQAALACWRFVVAAFFSASTATAHSRVSRSANGAAGGGGIAFWFVCPAQNAIQQCSKKVRLSDGTRPRSEKGTIRESLFFALRLRPSTLSIADVFQRVGPV